jgi:hypothetical protein
MRIGRIGRGSLVKLVSGVVMAAALSMGMAGCGLLNGSPSRPPTATDPEPPYTFQALFVPADTWGHTATSEGTGGTYVLHDHSPWIPVATIRGLLGMIGIESTRAPGRLALTAPPIMPVNLSHLPPSESPAASEMGLAMNGKAVDWLTVWKAAKQGGYVPLGNTVQALRRIEIKMRWQGGKRKGQPITWTVGAPNYRGLVATTEVSSSASDGITVMLWVHHGADWISGNGLGDAMPNDTVVNWPITPHGAVERLTFSVPLANHLRIQPSQPSLPPGKSEVPILVHT